MNAGQLYRFVHELKVDDLIVFPLKREPSIWLGRVVGAYQYDPRLSPEFPHTRAVEWLKKRPRTSFSQAALYEIGSALSFFQVKNFADEFLRALEQEGVPDLTEEDEAEAMAYLADDIDRQARDFVLKRIQQNLKGHGLAEFVGHLLTLMGYKIRVSPPGPDRGVDVVAHRDELGVALPTILVEVKSGDSQTNEAAVSELYGKVTEKDFGLFVALAGFTANARHFAFGKRNLRLLDAEDLVDLVFAYYDQLDAKYKSMIPLRRVFVPEPLTE